MTNPLVCGLLVGIATGVGLILLGMIFYKLFQSEEIVHHHQPDLWTDEEESNYLPENPYPPDKDPVAWWKRGEQPPI